METEKKSNEGEEMRDSFIFYASFAQAASMLGDKARLKLYDSVVKLGLCCAENETELNQVCAEIETSLAQNRNVLAQFLLIKPQIITNLKKWLGGNKGKEHGALGGAPKGNKNASKKQPLLLNENDNVNDNVNVKKNNKKEISQQFETWWAEYPNKKSKQDALKIFEKLMAREQVSFDELLAGAKAYAEHCRREKTDPHYIKHPSTWLNQGCWADEYAKSVDDNQFHVEW